MEVIIHVVGKINSNSSESHLIQEYLKRIKWKVKIIEYSYNSKLSEAKKILSNIDQGVIISLDEKGENLSSIQFSKMVEIFLENDGIVNIIIGGHDGIDDLLIKASKKLISFGKLTWPHKLVRVMLAEQLYRAYSIISNHPYHRE